MWRPTDRLKRWLFAPEASTQAFGGAPPAPEGLYEQERAVRRSYPWWQALCLMGAGYFSSLSYLPGIAFLAAGALSPLATLALVLVTLFGALPVYRRVAWGSPHGGGSLSMLERLLPFWQGKLLVLALLGFLVTDLVLTVTLSAADAAAHLAENPWLSPALGARHVAVTMVIVALLGAVLLRGVRRLVGVAVGLVVAYLVLSAAVIVDGLLKIAAHPDLLYAWRLELGRGDLNLPALVVASALLLPRLSVGFSGFETGVAVMPLVRGDPDDAPSRPRGRIRDEKAKGKSPEDQALDRFKRTRFTVAPGVHPLGRDVLDMLGLTDEDAKRHASRFFGGKGGKGGGNGGGSSGSPSRSIVPYAQDAAERAGEAGGLAGLAGFAKLAGMVGAVATAVGLAAKGLAMVNDHIDQTASRQFSMTNAYWMGGASSQTGKAIGYGAAAGLSPEATAQKANAFGDALRSGGTGASYFRARGLVDFGPFSIDKVANLTKAIDLLRHEKSDATAIRVARSTGLDNFLWMRDLSERSAQGLATATKGADTKQARKNAAEFQAADTEADLRWKDVHDRVMTRPMQAKAQMGRGLSQVLQGNGWAGYANMAGAAARFVNPVLGPAIGDGLGWVADRAEDGVNGARHWISQRGKDKKGDPVSDWIDEHIGDGSGSSQNRGKGKDENTEAMKDLTRTIKDHAETVGGGGRARGAIPAGIKAGMMDEALTNAAHYQGAFTIG